MMCLQVGPPGGSRRGSFCFLPDRVSMAATTLVRGATMHLLMLRMGSNRGVSTELELLTLPGAFEAPTGQ